VLVQGAKQRQRIKPDRVVSGSSSSDIIGVIMTQPAPFPADGRNTQQTHRLFQSPDGEIASISFHHLSILQRSSWRPHLA
jgi:hypothetical protein